MPLSALGEAAPLAQWLPLRAAGGGPGSWFVHIRAALSYHLMALRPPGRGGGGPARLGGGLEPDSPRGGGSRSEVGMAEDFMAL